MCLKSFIRYASLLISVVLVAAGFVVIQSPSAHATTGAITIVSSGGAAQGAGWTKTGGVITSTTSAVDIDASDVISALAGGDLQISATNIVVNAPVAWTQSTKLTLTATGALNINASIQAAGATAGLVMTSSPLYTLASGSGASIQLTGATPTLSINSTNFTVVNTKAQLVALTSSSTNVALGRSIALTDTYSDALITGAFASTFDGLGNTVSGLQIVAAASATTNLGFFAELRGATVRNFGLADVYIQSASTATTNNLRIGALAGSVGDASKTSGWSAAAYTTTLSRVWSSGTVSAKDSGTTDQQGIFFGGGLVGSLNNGALVVEDSRSSANVSAAGTDSSAMAVGGLLGDASNYPSGGGVHLEIRRSSATGSIVEGTVRANYYGSGGLVGVIIANSTSLILDCFSWSSIIATSLSAGGIAGYAGSGSITNVYTTYSSSGSGAATRTNFVTNVTNSTWATLPTWMSTSVWGLTAPGMPYLLDQTSPQLPLYVKVVAPTDGKYTSMSYQVVNASGTAVNLTTLGVNAPTGTVQYSIDPAVTTGTYSVSYVSGLTLGGTNGASYYLAPYTMPTSVTITSAVTPQTVTWNPTNTSALSSAASLTPNASATSSGSGAISYTVNNAGSTGCTVSGSNPAVISFSAAGDCVVRATAAGTTTEAAGYKEIAFNISVPLSQSVTWSPTNTQVLANASPLTPSVLATTSGTGAISYSVQSDTGSSCAVGATSGILTFSSAGTCVVRATASGNSTYSSAYQDASFTIGSTTTSMTVSLGVSVGNQIVNGPITYSSTGMQPGANWSLVLRSTPQTLASGNVGLLGALSGSNVIPSGLGPGWHSITLSGTSLNGGFVSTVVWFQIDGSGILLAAQTNDPSGSGSSTATLPKTGFAVGGYLLFTAMLLLLGAALVRARMVLRNTASARRKLVGVPNRPGGFTRELNGS